jgi:hypothetical protein
MNQFEKDIQLFQIKAEDFKKKSDDFSLKVEKQSNLLNKMKQTISKMCLTLNMDPTILERNSLSPKEKEKENFLGSNFFNATRSPKTVSFPQINFQSNYIHEDSVQVDRNSQITSILESEYNRFISSIIYNLSIFDENLWNMIVNINIRIIFFNAYCERYTL